MKRVQDIRQLIIKQVNGYFHKKMKIDERLLQAFEYSIGCSDGWMDSADIFTASIESLPSLYDQFLRAGVPNHIMSDVSMHLHNLRSFSNNSSYLPNIDETLCDIFSPGFGDLYKEDYYNLKKIGSISVLDIICGKLTENLPDLGESDNFINEFPANLLKSLKMEDRFWDQENSQFVSELVERLRYLWKIDTSIGDQQFIVYWDGFQYRIKPFGVSGIYQFSKDPLVDGSLWVARGNVLQPIKRFSQEAFEEIEYLINNDVSEKYFQSFFENNPEFLLALGGGKYINVHPQIVIHEDDGGRLIPDFLLEKINDSMCDICDLKLATQTIGKFKLHRPGFRSGIHEAIAQLDYYRNWFEDKANRNNFYSKTGLKAYRPKVVLIVGRNLDYYSDLERIQRESILPNFVELITYDDVIERAKMYKKIVY